MNKPTFKWLFNYGWVLRNALRSLVNVFIQEWDLTLNMSLSGLLNRDRLKHRLKCFPELEPKFHTCMVYKAWDRFAPIPVVPNPWRERYRSLKAGNRQAFTFPLLHWGTVLVEPHWGLTNSWWNQDKFSMLTKPCSLVLFLFLLASHAKHCAGFLNTSGINMVSGTQMHLHAHTNTCAKT